MSGPAGQEFKKLPFGEISWPMSGHEPIGDVVGSKSQRQLWNRAADGRRVRRQLVFIADAAERVAVATVRSCYRTVVSGNGTGPTPACGTGLRNARQLHAHCRHLKRPTIWSQSDPSENSAYVRRPSKFRPKLSLEIGSDGFRNGSVTGHWPKTSENGSFLNF